MRELHTYSADEQKQISELVAVAVQYKRGLNYPPQVIAKGLGFMAQQIISLAKENDIFIAEDEVLAKVLSMVELDEYIPFEAYEAVAQMLAVIFKHEMKGLK
jgi:flagellar biosynthesis protein